MPVQTRRDFVHSVFPSFMTRNMKWRQDKEAGQLLSQPAAKSWPVTAQEQPQAQAQAQNFSGTHHHRDSTSTTSTAVSPDSSPTSTISTIDSSLTEPSPSSSEPPAVHSRPPSYKENAVGDTTSVSDPRQASTGSQSPAKRPRNTKNLSLNMSGQPKYLSPQPNKEASSTEPSLPLSAPASPSFIVPPKQSKRKPSNLNLTIKTSSDAGSASPNPSRIVPATPGIRQSILRHHQSSPSLSIFSPHGPPEGGMRFPTDGLPSTVNRPRSRGYAGMVNQPFAETSSGLNPQPLANLEEEEDYDVPLSREAKSPAYPSGPLCIYDPHVYLYLEPSYEEASDFDVVINVAKEVKNPFEAKKSVVEPQTSSTPKRGSRDSIVEPDTAVSMVSFRTAFENMPISELESPATPKPIKQLPEYIHIPWEHNTNIVDDMLKLVEVIDQRVRQGKRVLIHCQCGVSRSATLVVAYGLYVDPELTVQEAYDAVKERSKWIGPNMNLIYQLTEFRQKLRSKKNAGAAKRSGRSNTITGGSPTTRTDLLGLEDQSLFEPRSAPLPDDKDRASYIDSDSPIQLEFMEMARNSKGASPTSSSGSRMQRSRSAESHGALWGSSDTTGSGASSPPSSQLHLEFPPHISPPTGFYLGPDEDKSLQQDVDMIIQDSSYEELMSPRVAEFTVSPFHNFTQPTKHFSSLETGLRSPGISATSTDPRSPAQRGEAPIIRDIFEVLQ